MQYKNDIANSALRHLASTVRIADVDTDHSIAARLIREKFQSALDRVTQAHQWSFAKGVAPLSVAEDNPLTGYRFAYTKPFDALTIRYVTIKALLGQEFETHPESRVPFEEIQVGNIFKIHTDLADAYAVYTRRLDPDQSFETYFADTVAAELADLIGPGLIANKYMDVKSYLDRAIKNAYTKGIANDISKQPQPRREDSPYILCRRGY